MGSPNEIFQPVPTGLKTNDGLNDMQHSFLNAVQQANKNMPWLTEFNQPVKTKLGDTERYDSDYNPYDPNQEFAYGQHQGAVAKWRSALAKFGVLTVGSFVTSLADIPNIVNAAAKGDADKLVDNPVNNAMYDLNQWAEKTFKNYTSAWEVNHPVANWIPFVGNTGNTWGDVVLKNLGFTTGALAGAFVTDAALAELTGGPGDIPAAYTQAKRIGWGLSKIFSNAETAEKLHAAVESGEDIFKAVDNISKLAKFRENARFYAAMLTASSSEAASEAIESKRTLTDALTKQYYQEHGTNPDANASADIERTASDAMLTRYALNVGLLTATNSLQFGSFFRPFNVAAKGVEAELANGARIGLKEGSFDVFEQATRSGAGKIKHAVSSAFQDNLSEAFEEGAQYWIQRSTDDYYTRKYNGETTVNDLVDAISKGGKDMVTTQEGLSNISLGFLTGNIIHAGKWAAAKIQNTVSGGVYQQEREALVNNILSSLNDTPFTGVFGQKYESAARSAETAANMKAAVEKGDLFDYQNQKHDQFYNAINTALRTHTFDLRMDQLQSLKTLPDEQFKEMWGMDKTDANAAFVSSYVDKIAAKAEQVKDIYTKTEAAFVNPFRYNYKPSTEEHQAENEQYLAFEDYKHLLGRNLSFMDEFKQRANGLENELGAYGITDVIEAQKLLPRNIRSYTKEINNRLKELNDELKIYTDGTLTAESRKEKNRINKEIKWQEAKKSGIEALDGLEEHKQEAAYTDLFHDLLQYQVRGDYVSSSSMLTRDLTEVFGKLQDHVQLSGNEKNAITLYRTLTTKKGFNSFFEGLKEKRKQQGAEAGQAVKDFVENDSNTRSEKQNEPEPASPNEVPADALQSEYEVATDKAADIFGPVGSKIVADGKMDENTYLFKSQKLTTAASFPKDYLLGLIKSGDLRATGTSNTPTSTVTPNSDTSIQPEYTVAKPGYESFLGKPGDKVVHQGQADEENHRFKTSSQPMGVTIPAKSVHQFVKDGILTTKEEKQATSTNSLRTFDTRKELFRTLTFADFADNTLEIISKLNSADELEGKIKAKEEKDSTVKTEPVFTSLNRLPNLFRKSASTKVNLYFNDGGKDIYMGILAEPGTLHYKNEDGDYIPIENAATTEWNRIFEGAATVPVYDRFMANLQAAMLLYEQARSGGLDNTAFSRYAKVHPVVHKLTVPGEQVRPKLSELDKRNLGVIDPATGERTGVIVSFRKVYNNNSKAVEYKPKYFIKNNSLKVKDKIQEWVDSHQSLIRNNIENSSLGTRYFSFAEFPTQKENMELILLHSAKQTDTDKQQIFENIRQYASTVSEAIGEDKVEKARKLSEALNEQLFLATDNKTQQFHKLSFVLNKTGGIGIEYSIANGNSFTDKQYNISKEELNKLNSLDELLEAVTNKAAANGDALGRISVSNYLNNDNKADYTQLAEGLTASVSRQIVKVSFDVLPRDTIFEQKKENKPISEQADSSSYVQVESPVPLKKDGTPDKRFKESRPIAPEVGKRSDTIIQNIQEVGNSILLAGSRYRVDSKGANIDLKKFNETTQQYEVATTTISAGQLKEFMDRGMVKPYVETDFAFDDLSIDNDEIAPKLADRNEPVIATDFEKMAAIMGRELPDSFGLENMNSLLARLRAAGKSMPEMWGALYDGTIYLNSQAPAGTIYHEVFHTVFRNLLSEEQIKKYLLLGRQQLNIQLAKQGTSINSILDKKRKSGLYLDLSSDEAKSRIVEESLADQYQQYRNGGRIATFFKDIFATIKNFFRFITGKNRNELADLFKSIRQGKFRHATIIDNRFTGIPEVMPSLVSYKFPVIEEGKIKTGGDGKPLTIQQTLSSDETAQAVRDITSYVLQYREQPDFYGKTKDAIADYVLDKLALILKKGSPHRDSFTSDYINKWVLVYSQDSPRTAIKENVRNYINAVSRLKEDVIDELQQEDEEGRQNNFDDKKEYNGGFANLSAFMRSYIGLAGEEVKDKHGKLIPLDASGSVVMKRTIDPVDVYYGLMRRLSNIVSKEDKLKALIHYAKDNKNTAIFVNNFIEDTGLDKDALFADEPRIEFLTGITKNPTLVNQFLHAFDKARMDYVKMTIDNNSEGPDIKVFYSNKRNIVNTQFDKWAKNFDYKSNFSEVNAKKLLQKFDDKASTNLRHIIHTKNYSEEIEASISDLKNDFEKIGISLSPGYLRYAILKSKEEFSEPLNEEDREFLQTMRIPDEFVLNLEVIDGLTGGGFNNPFQKAVTEDKDGNIILDDSSAATTRIRKLAEGNAYFDETVGESSFQNAEGKTIFAHQDITAHVKTFLQLRSPVIRWQLKENGAFDPLLKEANFYNGPVRKANWLLHDERFNEIANSLSFFRLDGLGIEQDKKSAANTQQYDDKVFGGFSTRELALFQLNSWLNKAENNNEVLTAPHYVRVLEASNSADFVMLPVRQFLSDDKIGQEASDFFTGEIEKEYKRITRENNRINRFKNSVQPDDIVVENFHVKTRSAYNTETGNTEVSVSWGGRSQQFSDNITQLAGEALAKELTARALNNTEETAIDAIDKERLITAVKDNIVSQVDKLIELLKENQVLSEDDKGGFNSAYLDKKWFAGSGKHGYSNNFRRNLLSFYLNNLINNWSFNQLIHGDYSLTYKHDGGIDAVKRAKGDNAAISSMAVLALAPELGIHKLKTHFSCATFAEPKGLSQLPGLSERDKETDRADAQMYATPEFLRYYFYSQGKLSRELADIITKIDNGEKVASKAVFEEGGLLDRNTMLNALKLVYKDQETYKKMSVVILAPELTSVKDKDGHWQPRPGMEAAHHLRTQMLERGIDVASPVSASKMFTANVGHDLERFSDLRGTALSADYFGLQQETPSNKIQITTPTQLIQLIDTEQDDNADVLLNGETVKIGEIKKRYQQALSDKFSNDYISARNAIYAPHDFEHMIKGAEMTGKVTPQLASFVKQAARSLADSGADAQLLEMFKLNELTGEPEYDLNAPFSRDKFVQLYLAYFSQSIFSSKSPGYAATLMSDFGVKVIKKALAVAEDGTVTKWQVIRHAQFDANHEGIKDAHILNAPVLDESHKHAVAAGKAVYYIDELKHNVPEYDQQGKITGYFTECLYPPHFTELADLKPGEDIPGSISKMFGARIPSQDKHSFITLKMVDFLPAYYGSTIITAKELVKLSGADFDIDKLYILRSDHYTKAENGNLSFHRYGEANTPEEKFNEYKDWNFKNNKPLKKIKADLFEKYYKNAFGEINDELKHLPREHFYTARKHDLQIEKQRLTEQLNDQALEALKLPTTTAAYQRLIAKTGRELNNGVANNDLLDTVMALQTNDHIRPVIAQTPASMSYLQDMKKNEVYKEGNHSVYGEKIVAPVDSPLGQLIAHRNNTRGKDNIGINVSGEKAFTLLSKAGTKLSDTYKGLIKIGDWSFEGFDKMLTADGHRIMDMLSTLVSSATDEAKEQLNAYFRLGVEQLKLITPMVAGGASLQTAIDWVNQPVIRTLYELKEKNRTANGRLTVARLREKTLEQVSNDFKDRFKGQSDGEWRGIDAPILTEILRGNAGMTNSLSYIHAVESQKQILKQLELLEKISNDFYKVNRLLNLSKALPSDWEGIDEIYQVEKDLLAPEAAFDISGIINGGEGYKHEVTAVKLQALKELDAISGKTFIERTPIFRSMFQTMLSNLSSRMQRDWVARKELMRELMQFIQIAAYKQRYIAENEKLDESMRPSLIYGTEDTIIDELKKALALKPGNVFLRFLIPVSNTRNKYNHSTGQWEKVPNPENKDRLNKLEMNTRAYVDGVRLENLMIGFKELYYDPNTRHIAETFVHYLMVKDGLLYKNGSFIKLLPVEVLDNYHSGLRLANCVLSLSNEQEARNWLNDNKGSYRAKGFELHKEEIEEISKEPEVIKALYPVTFGHSTEDLLSRFADIYGKDIRHGNQVQYIQSGNAEEHIAETGNKLSIRLTTKAFDPAKKEEFLQHLDEANGILNKAGFKITDAVIEGNRKRRQIVFPYFIRTSNGFYKLSSVKRYSGQEVTEPSKMLENNLGSSATYEKAAQVGTFNSTNIADVETAKDQIPVYQSRLKAGSAAGSSNLISEFLLKNPGINFTYTEIADAFATEFQKNPSYRLEEYLDKIKCSGL